MYDRGLWWNGAPTPSYRSKSETEARARSPYLEEDDRPRFVERGLLSR